MIRYENRWAIVTGASSGLGRGIAQRLAERGMSLVLTGRNLVRLQDTVHQIRRTLPDARVEIVPADLSTASGVSRLLEHVGDREVEVLVNNAGFGSYGAFADADAEREAAEIGVDVGAVVALSRAFLPGMVARGSGGILNVASTIAFQPAPFQAVYGASKAFVLSFSQALWFEARAAGVAVTALCPGPTRTGFVEALEADVRDTPIYRRLAEPGPVIAAGLRALDRGRAVLVPGFRNRMMSMGGRFLPAEWMTRVTARLLRPAAGRKVPIEVRNEAVIRAPARLVWDLLTDVERWPIWYAACRWVRVEQSGPKPSGLTGLTFRWRAFPVTLRSTVTASERPTRFEFVADAPGLHAERTFTISPCSDGQGVRIVSHETQVGWLPTIARRIIRPHLKAANQVFFDDLARVAGEGTAVGEQIPSPGCGHEADQNRVSTLASSM